MKLHESSDEFRDLITLAAQHHKLRDVFIEKDYWLTTLLKNIATSEENECVVFKGGTSLSKAFNMIERFSEDIDLAVLLNEDATDNQKKRLVKRVEKAATNGFSSASVEAEKTGMESESKGSKFRKTWWTYSKIGLSDDFGQAHPYLLLEINAFADPNPYSKESLTTYIADFLRDTGQEKVITEFGLESFTINVLSRQRTLVEKLMGLIKATHESDNEYDELGRKIRHIYDVHQLIDLKELSDWTESEDFFKLLKCVHDNDRSVHGKSAEWCNQALGECTLFAEFDKVWGYLESVWNDEFKSLVYCDELPSTEKVKQKFVKLHKRLQEYDRLHPASDVNS